MTLLITFVLVALVFSFLCSIAEAVILSVTPAHVALLESEGKPTGPLLSKLKKDINKSLAAILTLNTVAHTVGAAGAGAQAAIVFGNAYVGVASAILTILILVFSEIIPKTLGAQHWRRLAVPTAHGLKYLIWILYPFVLLSEKLTGGMGQGSTLTGFSRSEFVAMADLSSREGNLARKESEIFKNLLYLENTRVKDAMTPRTVVFSVADHITVEEYFHKNEQNRFSRIPIYKGERDQVSGFVLRTDLLLAQARGNTSSPLSNYRRDIPVVLDSMAMSAALTEFFRVRVQIMLVMSEYGSMQGILTLEDVLETLLGMEIVDEGDSAEDMQVLARKLWRKRAREYGISLEQDDESQSRH